MYKTGQLDPKSLRFESNYIKFLPPKAVAEPRLRLGQKTQTRTKNTHFLELVHK
jgi:hypothetical protein